MIQIQSSAHAESYFNDALSQTGYYINGQEQAGWFLGKVAERLGITGLATKDVFQALCRNTNPVTSHPLTPRTTENRTIYYDINIHCPKSATLAYALYGDDRVLTAAHISNREIMQEIEADAQTRIRKNGQNDNRTTGELLWAEFPHLTARPVDEDTAPDPHLHFHNTVFNVTWDEAEQVYKAGMFRDIKRDMPYYQERFYKRLADRLMDLGYSIRRTATSFEIDTIPQAVIDLFSKRTQQVNRIAQENNITDADKLDQLGAKTRAKKNKNASLADLKADWLRQIAALNLTDEDSSKETDQPPIMITPQQCIDHALLHQFERSSVAYERRALASAYRHGLGCSGTSLEAITKAFEQDSRIIRIQDGMKSMCTTHEVLAEEKRMCTLANDGKGKFAPLYITAPPLTLTGEHADAAIHLLTSTDAVNILRGGAGTGKTTLLKEIVRQINLVGIQPVMVAPTASAARDTLRGEGFNQADTIAKLLIDPDMQAALQNGMLIVDESGLLGVRETSAILELANRYQARVILVGDTRQHSSVTRGDALRILNTLAGIKPAEINRIYRQRQEVYRKAVEDIAAGQIQSAFDRMETINAITEADTDTLNAQLVADYQGATRRGKSVLVVSPTHRRAEAVTASIRQALRDDGKICQTDSLVTRLVNLNYTNGDKTDARMYQPGLAIQFNQNLTGIRRGSIWEVQEASANAVTITDPTGKTVSLPLDKADRFTVYRKTSLPVSTGDRITITRGSFDQQGKRLNNGQSLKVLSVNDDGMVLINPATRIEYVLGTEFGHINHGYAITSHSSQGRTVDEVFIMQPSDTLAASNMKQFYVSVSRARDKVHIYTDDKATLMEQVSTLGDRLSAHELIGPNQISRFVAEQQAQHLQPIPHLAKVENPEQHLTVTQNRPYAPEPT